MSEPVSGRGDILVVDDNSSHLDFLASMLRNQGYKVRAATDGPRALKAARASAPELVLLDINMPEMSGFDVCRELKADAALKDVPILFVSAADESLDKVTAFHLGAADYVTKPFQFPEVLGRVEVHLHRARLLRELAAKNGELVRQVERAEDATRELDRERTRQLNLKDQLLSNISHELRTPLTALHQFVTLVTDGIAGPLNPEQREYLGIALRNAQQLNRMIGDLLDSTRAEEGKLRYRPESVRLEELMDETVPALRALAAGKNVDLTCAHQERLLPVRADPVRLRQVLFNLLDNAIKFTPAGGRVEVVARPGSEAGFVQVSVSDTAGGISPDVQQRLFERLYQEDRADASSRRGLGLGLYIAKQIVQTHGGRIWVESEQQRGSTFHFTVPIDGAQAGRAPGKET